MPTLHDPARHEPLVERPWDERRAHEAIAWIVRETEAAYRPTSYWPVHPKDLAPGEDPSAPSTSLYFGAVGVVWALRYPVDHLPPKVKSINLDKDPEVTGTLAAIKGQYLVWADGRVLNEFTYDWYETDLLTSQAMTTWHDARDAMRRFANRVADAYQPHAG